MRQIYLDHNSTSPIDPQVIDAMVECHQAGYVNPASQHRMGQIARQKLEFLRSDIVDMLGGNNRGVNADQLIFTSGGTESNNLALFGLCLDEAGQAAGQTLVSAVEHPSVLEAAESLRQQGASVDHIPVDTNGIVKLNELEVALDKPTRLVSVMAANNETGVIQPVQEIGRLCRSRSAIVHCDAVQAVGKIQVNFRELEIDAMTLAAHKFQGPRGIGALLVKSTARLNPIFHGGFQQMGIRPGTEDVALVAGLHRALQLFLENKEVRQKQTEDLRDLLQARILNDCQQTAIVGSHVHRTPNCLNVCFPRVDRQAFLMAADLQGLAISTGSACASGSSDLSHVLLAMGLSRTMAEGSIRMSLSHLTTRDEINMAADRIAMIYKDLQR